MHTHASHNFIKRMTVHPTVKHKQTEKKNKTMTIVVTEYELQHDLPFLETCTDIAGRFRADPTSVPMRRKLAHLVIVHKWNVSEHLANIVDFFAFHPGIVSDRNIHFLVRVEATTCNASELGGLTYVRFRDVAVDYSMLHPLDMFPSSDDDDDDDDEEENTLFDDTPYDIAERQRLNVAGRFGALDDWDTSLVTNMSDLFHFTMRLFNEQTLHCFFYTQLSLSAFDLSRWDVSNVRDMSWAFAGLSELPKGLQHWDVSNVRLMVGTFWNNYSKITQCWRTIEGWDVRSVVAMTAMFAESQYFTADLHRWNVSQVQDMSHMFDECVRFNGCVDGWNVAQVRDMSHMFQNCFSFNQFIATWKNMGTVGTNCDCMFDLELVHVPPATDNVMKTCDCTLLRSEVVHKEQLLDNCLFAMETTAAKSGPIIQTNFDCRPSFRQLSSFENLRHHWKIGFHIFGSDLYRHLHKTHSLGQATHVTQDVDAVLAQDFHCARCGVKRPLSLD